jgi:hypothetical protein
MKKLIFTLILPFSFIDQAFAINATADATVVQSTSVSQTA